MHQSFANGFEKSAELSKKDIKRHADTSELAQTGAALGQIGGVVGGFLVQRNLGKRLMKNHEEFPYYVNDKNVSDLHHLSNARPSWGTVPNSTSEKLKEIADLGEDFMKEHGLRDSKLVVNVGRRGKLGDYYNPVKHSINLGTLDKSVALHEMGHAADIKGSVTKHMLRSAGMSAALGAVPLALGFGDVVKERIPGTTDDKIISFIQDHPVLTSMGGYTTGILYPEAKASYLALKHIAKKQGQEAMWQSAKKTLGPAFATYLAGALPLMGGAYVAKKFYDYGHNKKASVMNENFRAGFEKSAIDWKAFALGAGAMGIPATAFAYYQMKNRASKDLAAVNKEIARRGISGAGWPTAMKKQLIKSNENAIDWQYDNPELTAALVGAGTGAVGGLLANMYMENMD
jgi:hypothetical protein